ncbi:hypothetical protein HDE_12796 [Halotydeus destructor]|nr:hypothetical protein HDE_12796 [Halotydeus destructor]
MFTLDGAEHKFDVFQSKQVVDSHENLVETNRSTQGGQWLYLTGSVDCDLVISLEDGRINGHLYIDGEEYKIAYDENQEVHTLTSGQGQPLEPKALIRFGRQIPAGYLKLHFVADTFLMQEWFTNDEPGVKKYFQDIVDILNKYTKKIPKVPIEVSLAGMDIWKVQLTQKIDTADNYNANYAIIYGRDYYGQGLYDASILITGKDFPRRQSGDLIAWNSTLDSVCKSTATAVVSYSQSLAPVPVDKQAKIILHEIGHILGQGEVKNGDTKCGCAATGCIMSPNSYKSEKWDTCTVQTIEKKLTSKDGACLLRKTGEVMTIPPVGPTVKTSTATNQAMSSTPSTSSQTTNVTLLPDYSQKEVQRKMSGITLAIVIIVLVALAVLLLVCHIKYNKCDRTKLPKARSAVVAKSGSNSPKAPEKLIKSRL